MRSPCQIDCVGYVLIVVHLCLGYANGCMLLSSICLLVGDLQQAVSMSAAAAHLLHEYVLPS